MSDSGHNASCRTQKRAGPFFIRSIYTAAHSSANGPFSGRQGAIDRAASEIQCPLALHPEKWALSNIDQPPLPPRIGKFHSRRRRTGPRLINIRVIYFFPVRQSLFHQRRADWPPNGGDRSLYSPSSKHGAIVAAHVYMELTFPR